MDLYPLLVVRGVFDKHIVVGEDERRALPHDLALFPQLEEERLCALNARPLFHPGCHIDNKLV